MPFLIPFVPTGRLAAAAVVALAVGATVFLHACAPLAEPEVRAAGFELRLGMVSPVATPQFGVDATITTLTGARLFPLLIGGLTEGGLVHAWTRSPDGRQLTLLLRPDLKFHDGTALNARTVSPLIERGAAAQIAAIPGGLSVSATSDLELSVALERPSARDLEEINIEVALPRRGDAAPVGSGPFVVRERTDERVSLEAFDDYYGGPPTVRRLDIVRFSTLRSAWSAMLRGEIDGLMEAPVDAVGFIEAASEFRTYAFPRPFAYMLAFNLRDPVLADVELRRAMAGSVRRDRLVASALRGRGQPSLFQVYPEHWVFDTEVAPLSASMAEAREVVRTRGAPLRLRCLLPDFDRFARVGQELQRQLADVGIDLELEPVTFAELRSRLRDGRFQAVVLEANGGSDRFVYAFWHSSAQAQLVNSGYTSADEALDRWRGAATRDEARAAMRAIQTIMRDDPPAVFLAWPQTVRVLHGRFEVPAEAAGRDIISTRYLPYVRLR